MLQDSAIRSIVRSSQSNDTLDGDLISTLIQRFCSRDICGNPLLTQTSFSVSALNVSNKAAAIVLYEALRQIGFPGMDV